MFKPSKIALAALAVLGGFNVALAQTPQRVEITGSNIKRIDLETSSPVQVISREEISRSGAGSVRDLIDLLPSATPSLSDVSGSNSFASGASSATLRNLGKTSTLVLLNSRRVSPYALADFNEVFTNLDSLPLDAIERIEILKSGASAVYGSDAVAGVINIITRRSYQGLQINGQYEQSMQSHRFGNGTVSLTGGLGDFEKDRYNILANVELYKRDSVMWRDVLSHMNPVTFRRIPQTFAAQASTFSYPGNVVGASPAAIAGCASDLVVSNLCRHDRYSRFEAQPSAERSNLLVSGRVNLGQGMEGFAEVVYSRTKTTYQSPYAIYGNINTAGVTVWGNPQTNGAQTFTYRGLGASHPLNPLGADDVDFRYRFVDGPSEATAESDNYRVLTGLRGFWRGYDWETALGMMGSKVSAIDRGRFSKSGFVELIGDYDLDPLPADFFNKANGYKIGQPNSATIIDRLFPGYGSEGKTTQVAWDAKLTGELGRLGAGPIGFAAGVDVRKERFSIDPTQNLRNGDIVGVGLSATDGNRTFMAAFGELSLQPLQNLEVQLAARLDKYPNLSANISPKVGFSFKPTPGVLLRGGVEEGFRAPNLTETAPSVKFAFNNGVRDPKRCEQAEALAADLLLAAETATPEQATVLEARADTVAGNECAAGVAAIVGNNPKLKPEISRSFTLGLVLQPTSNFNVALDYWNITRKNEIDLRGATELLSAEDSGLPSGSSIARDPLTLDSTFTEAERGQYGVTAGALNSITRSFENISKTKTSGIDLSVNSRIDLPVGPLTLEANGTYLHSFRRFSPVRNGYGDNLAGRWTYPRFSASISASLKTGNFRNGIKLRHSGGTSLQGDFFDTGWDEASCLSKRPISVSAGECRVAPDAKLDYSFQYTGVKNLTLGVYVRNLLNKFPPADLRDLAENGSNIIPQERGDAQRRTLRLSVEYRFL